MPIKNYNVPPFPEKPKWVEQKDGSLMIKDFVPDAGWFTCKISADKWEIEAHDSNGTQGMWGTIKKSISAEKRAMRSRYDLLIHSLNPKLKKIKEAQDD